MIAFIVAACSVGWLFLGLYLLEKGWPIYGGTSRLHAWIFILWLIVSIGSVLNMVAQ